jgi:hypothetical protein
VHQDNVLLDRSAARETSSLLPATALQRSSSIEVRLHEQVSTSRTFRLIVVVIFVLQWMHAKQLLVKDAKSADDDAAASTGSATSNSNAIKRHVVQELQVDRAKATGEASSAADSREERGSFQVQHRELRRVDIEERRIHKLFHIYVIILACVNIISDVQQEESELRLEMSRLLRWL